MRPIDKISQTRLKELLHYDPITGNFTRSLTSNRWTVGDIAGSTDRFGRVKLNLDKLQLPASHAVYLYMIGSVPTGKIMYKNGDPGDNSWANLMVCDGSTLKKQRRKRRASLNIRGVSYIPTNDTYRVRLNAQYGCGAHKTLELALLYRAIGEMAYDLNPEPMSSLDYSTLQLRITKELLIALEESSGPPLIAGGRRAVNNKLGLLWMVADEAHNTDELMSQKPTAKPTRTERQDKENGLLRLFYKKKKYNLTI